MSKLHTGLLHRDLEPALTTEIQSLKSADSLESVMILVGSRLLGDYLGWRCAEKGFNLFNVRFVSFAELADDLSLEDRLVDSRPLMPPHGEFLYLLDAVSNLKTPHYFDKVSGRFSFIRTLKASFNNLDEALIDKLDALVIKPQDHSDKLTVLAGLRRSYQDNINRFRRPLDNFIPPDNPKKSFSDAYNTGHLIIYGFYDFNAAQRALLKSLAEEIELSVYLPWCEGDVTGSAFQFAQPTVRFFEKLISDAPPTLAGGDNVVLYSPPAITSITCHPIVNSYGHRLFNFGAAKNEDPETSSKHNLVVFNASDQAAEVRSIVGRINEAALWDEIPLSRIGIILWQPDSYLPLLKHELERAGLPFYDAIGETLAQTSECRAFLSLLNMCGRTIERKALVDLIASYELKLRVTNKNPEVSGQVVYSTNKTEPDPVAWETISIQTGIVDGDLQCWLSALDYLSSSSEVNQDRVGADLSSPTESGLSKLAPTRYSSFISDEQITLFREFIEALFGMFDEIPNENEWDDFVEHVVLLAEDFLPAGAITDQIIETVQSTSSSEVFDSNRIGRATFTAIITELLKKTKIAQSGRYRVDGITICDRMTSRGVGFDFLVIPGLTQGSVPVKPHDDPFLNDHDRISLNKTLFRQDYSTSNMPMQLPLKSYMLDEERLLFALAVDSAEKRLYLSFPDRSVEGKKLLPSRFLLEMCRIVTGEPVETGKIPELDFFEDDTQLSPDDQDKRLERCAVDEKRFVTDKLLLNTPDHLRHEAFKQAYSGRSDQYQRGIKVAIQRAIGEHFTTWDGVMPEGWSQPQLIPSSFSASALENYAGCPFAYFISHILKATEWEEPEMLFEPPPQAVGSLIHKVLEQFFIKTRDVGNLPLNENVLGWAEAEIESILSDNIKRSRARYPAPRALWDIEEQRIIRRLKAFLKNEIALERDFCFVDAEVAIKQKLTLKTDTVPFSFQLTGKIDRIDRSSDSKSIRIIDYKTGNAPSNPEDFRGGTCLQLPLYLLAALEMNPESELLESSAEFLQIGSEGKIKLISMSGEWLGENEAELGQIVRVLTSGIRGGLFPPIPERTKCSRCTAQYLCDFRSRKSYEYRKDDQRLDGLRKIGCLK